MKGPEAEQRAVLQRIRAFQAPDAFVSCQPPERKVRGFAQVDQSDSLRPSRRESSPCPCAIIGCNLLHLHRPAPGRRFLSEMALESALAVHAVHAHRVVSRRTRVPVTLAHVNGSPEHATPARSSHHCRSRHFPTCPGRCRLDRPTASRNKPRVRCRLSGPRLNLSCGTTIIFECPYVSRPRQFPTWQFR